LAQGGRSQDLVDGSETHCGEEDLCEKK
jgi:hypothetical protein